MRLSISNLAWNVPDDGEVAALLQEYGIDAIDIAPGKYFPDFATASSADLARVRDWWGDRGIALTGLQALLFGTTGLNLFGSAAQQAAMLAHLDQVCRIGAGLGATRLAFGSPRNRDRSSLTDEQTRDVALAFFRRLAEIARRHGVVVCLEPNPPCYGANFMTCSAETAGMVAAVSDPAIRMLADTGASTINGEDFGAVLRAHGALVGHVHLSEPDLVVLGDGGTDHGKAAAALRASLPDHVVCVEMLPAKNEPGLAAVARALAMATALYRDAAGPPDEAEESSR